MSTIRNQTGALIALNAGLLLLLGVVTLAPQADAQRQTRRAPGEYTMVAARPQALSQDAIFIVDSTNMELMTVYYDQGAKSLKFIDFRDLQLDLDNADQQRRP